MSDVATRDGISEAPTRRRLRRGGPAVLIVGTLFAVTIGWYLSRPQPLVVQGEIQSCTFDIAPRVDGRVLVVRSQSVPQERREWL